MTQNSSSSTLNYVIDKINRRLIINTYKIPGLRTQIDTWLAVANENSLEKIWIWSDLADIGLFITYGFVVEGIIADSAIGTVASSMAYFTDTDRQKSMKLTMENEIIHNICHKPVNSLKPLPASITLRLLAPSDCQAISELLTAVFATYPTPVADSSYIKSLFTKGCIFAGAIYKDKNLIALSAAYPDLELNRCEITDCATLAQYRGFSLTSRLIPILEFELGQSLTFYTLARATSWGMNRIFHRLGYQLQGRLINNCNISGGFEDMNLWVKVKPSF